MEHKHIYDEQGRQLCCTLEDKINNQTALLADATLTSIQDGNRKEHNHEQDHDHDHEHAHQAGQSIRFFLPAIISGALLLLVLGLDHVITTTWFQGWIRLAGYTAAYLPVGFPVVREAFVSIRKGNIFSEFFLMTLATIGAFAIGEYPEAVAVMLFYAVGEIFQTLAVSRAKASIKSLLDQRPDEVMVLVDAQARTMKASAVEPGAIVQLRAGEQLALDGILLSETGFFNTAALTGESKPDRKAKDDTVLAGMINLDQTVEVKVTAGFSNTKLSRILQLVQEATTQKAPTELFIRKFARIYTPIVVLLAVLLCLLPYFFVADYIFREWLYKALVFLVISCPCALVISIPLGYFGGIGAAGKQGILFKGGQFLDRMAGIEHVVMDKTGTITEGIFEVQEVVFKPGYDQQDILAMISALESHSTHPVARAIQQFAGRLPAEISVKEAREISGHGLTGRVQDKVLLVGNFKLMDQFGIIYDTEPGQLVYTTIAVAYDDRYIGYITIADRIKPDARLCVDRLTALSVKTTILSGDKASVVKEVAATLGVAEAFGDLLPEDKVDKVKAIKATGESVCFIGDGINDAPVIAVSDVGMAMGGLGSDAAIETADVVIQDDKPGKIPLAINISKQTKKVVWQNIALAFGVKIMVLALGAGGIATMWEAVFADVGVALLAILNAVRLQHITFK